MTDADDLRFARRVLTLMLWDQPADTVPQVLAFVHPGVPVAKERPRFNRRTGRVYTPATTEQAEEALAWAFVNARGRSVQQALQDIRTGRLRQPKPFHDTVALVACFFVPTRRRKDTDNLLKLVMDAGNRAKVWRDDACVVRVVTCIELDRARPRSVIALAPCLATLSTAPLLTASGAI